ncbi:tail completion protein gp17 [Conchiformibius kuhniae]|uniref:DUF3168 domain-containing protein n=1 Tax=Conchiformibius kuhniae TaxID=211502 RepID=A0A8T9MTY3_9NEIS|nr:DUF3168 domain-containing protein [Conchiformibius kuhniae]UOP05340.1 DUF3168 domain-containing protein [Conchiformibius kuhniae]
MLERKLIAAVKAARADAKVYHDFAPEEAKPPFVLLARVGGAGRPYLGGDAAAEVRVQISAWAAERLAAVELSQQIETALYALPEVSAAGAAVSAFDDGTGWRGMMQDFIVLEQTDV